MIFNPQLTLESFTGRLMPLQNPGSSTFTPLIFGNLTKSWLGSAGLASPLRVKHFTGCLEH